eukprot:gene13141-3933_t
MDAIVRLSGRLKANQSMREFLAEMMGTFILMVFGIGSVAQLKLGKEVLGGFLSVNISWGLGVTFGVFWSLGISGGHINPAVTLAMACFGRLKWRKLPVYWAGQTLGSFLASACMYGIYKDALNIYDGGTRHTEGALATAGIWSTYPFSDGKKSISNWSGFSDQIFGTMILVGTIFALTDNKNNGAEPKQLPYMVGCLVWVIGMTLGLNCGYGINPARDLMPRIFTAMAGWGTKPFTVHDHWFWYPVFGQLIGGVLGGVLYTVTISMHHHHEYEVSNTPRADDVIVKFSRKSGDDPGCVQNKECEVEQ